VTDVVAREARAGPSGATLVGTWKLLTCDIEFQDTRQREYMYGCPARGHAIFTPSGRVVVYVEACERTPPTCEREWADCQRRMIAYTGTYEFEDGCWTTFVDGAWNVRWRGTAQKRFIEIHDMTLHATSDWYPSPLHQGRMGRVRVSWQRE
jgi:hypothetical protein